MGRYSKNNGNEHMELGEDIKWKIYHHGAFAHQPMFDIELAYIRPPEHVEKIIRSAIWNMMDKDEQLWN